MDRNKEISEKLKEELNQEKLKNKELLQRLQKVQKRLSQYEHASDGASEGLWERDLITGEVFISPPWAKMLGFEPEEVESDKYFWENLIHPEDKSMALNSFESYIRGEADKYDIDFRLKTKDGEYIWVHSKAKVSKNEQGKAIRISGSHTDITEKKRSAVQLRASEKKYKHLFENSLIGMMRVKATSWDVTEINQKGLQILALQEPKRHMKFQEMFVEPEQIREITDLIQKHGVVEDFEVKVLRWDESETWISLSAVVFEDVDQNFYDIIFRDISEFKGNLIELQRLNFELDNFVYHASHDIRSPLRSMMGLIEILKTERNPSEVKKIVEMISGSVNRLDKFVVDLLAMSRNNRLTEPTVLINFMVEINNSVTNFHHVFTTKDLEIRVKIHEVVPFYSDLTKIRIILNNLISNSIKYRRTSAGLVSFIHIYVTTSPENVIIKIEDNGEGISPDKLEKIFDMFYRASENSEGSGLGMYIVKNVIKKLDAEIKVESEEKIGTTFIVTIPNRK
ncbi:PAS domain-containing protein [Marivirga sp. S37H4]|uniref:histidine kinase n=1 Tax=Marivirga aurantiaca TaxID=2802615 RepID=A0A934X2W5_9BACT|nr:PAS domain-containing protein [Marivirga aurantiaca]MBK6267442.1 PAS domain-containing protein [Marivirga aurantiaca]